MDKKRNSIKDNGFKEIKEIFNKVAIDLDKVAIEIAELKESQKKTDKQIGNLTDGWGKFVEGLVAPSVPKIFSKLGIKVFGIDQRALRRFNGKEMEIDVLCLGKQKTKEVVIAAEVKSVLGIEDVKYYINSLGNFFKFFTEYKGSELIGVVSGIKMEKGVAQFAEKQGLYVLAPSGETMVMLNKKGFKPHIWH